MAEVSGRLPFSPISYVDRLNVLPPKTTRDCIITGMAMVSPPRMLVSDTGNDCLKMLDIAEDTIIQTKPLGSRPESLTIIPGKSMIAVAMYHQKKIRYFKLDETLTQCGTVDVDGSCMGVASTGDRLVVSYDNPPMVQIMDLDGKNPTTIATDSTGNELFSFPTYLTLSPDNKSIYVSDRNKNAVISFCFTRQTLRWQYKPDDLGYPRGVTVGGNSCLYIFGQTSQNIHVVSSSGTKLAVVSIDESWNLPYPRGLYFCKYDGLLYASSGCEGHWNLNSVKRLTQQ